MRGYATSADGIAMTTTSIPPLVSLPFVLPTVAAAHPGHGHTHADSALHYLTEPVHALVLLVSIVGVSMLVAGRHSRRRRQTASKRRNRDH